MKRWTALLMVAPAVLLAVGLWVLPSIAIGGLSLFDSSLLKSSWSGLRNFVSMWGDPHWTMAVVNSLVLSVILVTCNTLVSLAIALPASSLPKRWRSGIRISVYIPSLSAGIIIGQFWVWVWRNNGLANWLLSIVGLPQVRWLSTRWLSVPIIGSIVVSAVVGGVVVIYLAALEGVPRELREAARIDGAGVLRVWRYVDIPYISRPIAITMLMALVAGFSMWETPYVMTRGGPDGASASVMYALWESAFVRQQYGMAAAQSIMMLVIVSSILLVSRRLSR